MVPEESVTTGMSLELKTADISVVLEEARSQVTVEMLGVISMSDAVLSGLKVTPPSACTVVLSGASEVAASSMAVVLLSEVIVEVALGSTGIARAKFN